MPPNIEPPVCAPKGAEVPPNGVAGAKGLLLLELLVWPNIDWDWDPNGLVPDDCPKATRTNISQGQKATETIQEITKQKATESKRESIKDQSTYD